jgi:hypothetical protein
LLPQEFWTANEHRSASTRCSRRRAASAGLKSRGRAPAAAERER